MKSTYGTDLEVMMPIGDNPQRIGWATRYKDLAALEVVAGKLPADVKYWEIVGKGIDYFIAGSIQDSIWRTLWRRGWRAIRRWWPASRGMPR